MYGTLSFMKYVKQKKKHNTITLYIFEGDIDMYGRYKATKDQKFRGLQTKVITVVTSG